MIFLGEFDFDILTRNALGEILLGLRSERLIALGYVDAPEPDLVALSAAIEDMDGIAFGDLHHLAGAVQAVGMDGADATANEGQQQERTMEDQWFCQTSLSSWMR